MQKPVVWITNPSNYPRWTWVTTGRNVDEEKIKKYPPGTNKNSYTCKPQRKGQAEDKTKILFRLMMHKGTWIIQTRRPSSNTRPYKEKKWSETSIVNTEVAPRCRQDHRDLLKIREMDVAEESSWTPTTATKQWERAKLTVR